MFSLSGDITMRITTLAAVSLAFASVLGGCGEKKKSSGGGGYTGEVERHFAAASATSNVPMRMLMAVGYLESRLSPDNARAQYKNLKDSSTDVYRGTLMTETAFGLTFKELGLDPDNAESSTLTTQIDAYAAWLGENTKDLGLALTPATPSDQFYWINNLALLHRKGIAQRRNVQVVFAMELIKILNEGFTWQDPTNGEFLRMTPAAPAIDPVQFPADGQQWLALDVQDGQVIGNSGIEYLRLATTPTDEIQNKPKGIDVIHCPLTLSACLELQTRNEESDVHIAAHYVVPQDKSIFRGVIQVADLRESVVLTNSKGVDTAINDRVVIMLVGNSGRIVDGTRMPAIPTWFSASQLKSMGSLINDVCQYLEAKNPKLVKFADCVSTDTVKGVNFLNQGNSDEYRWGEIPDFEPTIFGAYVKDYAGLDIEVAFEFYGGQKEFVSGTPMIFNVLFNPRGKQVVLERLTRCRNGKTVWETRDMVPTRNVSRAAFDDTVYDSGPNRNGEQFYRALVFGEDDSLIGWSIDRVVMRNYEAIERFAPDSLCRY
jgi:hypothetical protein